MSVLVIGDCRETMRRWITEGVRAQMCVTSPPYWGLRDYGVAGQLGLEPTIAEYVANMVEAFGLVRDMLADDGVLWLNLGDSYAANRGNGASGIGEKQATNVGANLGRLVVTDGLKPKDLCGIPWRVAFALQADGWWLRQEIIWSKPNPMPESVTDRCTKAHESLFLLAKSERYYYNAAAIAEPATAPAGAYKTPDGWDTSKGVGGHGSFHREGREAGFVGYIGKSGNRERKDATERGCPASGVAGSVPWEGSVRNRRSVWTIATQPYAEAHFATFPRALVEPCIAAGSRVGDVVLDPFMGSGTVGQVAQDLGRKWLGCELSESYAGFVEDRTRQAGMAFA